MPCLSCGPTSNTEENNKIKSENRELRLHLASASESLKSAHEENEKLSAVIDSIGDNEKLAVEEVLSLNSLVDRLNNKLAFSEAISCAILNQLRRVCDSEHLSMTKCLEEAGNRSGVPVMSWWSDHLEGDKFRLAKELDRFSDDERFILKEILSQYE